MSVMENVLPDSDSSGHRRQYTSNFMRNLRNTDAAQDVPVDILRRYPQAEFYNSKQQFDPEQIGATTNRIAREMVLKPEFGIKSGFGSAKPDASLQPQLGLKAWGQGCGHIIQVDAESQSGTQTTTPGPIASVKSHQTAPPGNLPSTAPSGQMISTGRQPGLFAPGSRPHPSALASQPGSARTGPRGAAEFGHVYANTYRPPRDSTDFRQNRPPFGRGRGMPGRIQDDYDPQMHGSNRFPPPLFSHQRQGNQNFGQGNRGNFTSRRHTQSTGDNVPEWFTDNDSSAMMELGGIEMPSSGSSTPAESSGDESGNRPSNSREDSKSTGQQHRDHYSGYSSMAKDAPNTNSAALGESVTSNDMLKNKSIWENIGDKDRPASQQMDYTYLLWSTLQNDLAASVNEDSSKSGSTLDALTSSAPEITGSKLWSIWKETAPAQATAGSGSFSNFGNLGPSQMHAAGDDIRKSGGQNMSLSVSSMIPPGAHEAAAASTQNHQQTAGGGVNLRDWLENAHVSERAYHQAQRNQQLAVESLSLRVATADVHGGQNNSSSSPAPRGLNPNELFAKFSSSNGGSNAVSSSPSNVNTSLRASPPVMSVEDLERKLMMKKQASAKAQHHNSGGDKSHDFDRDGHQMPRSSGQLRSLQDNASTQPASKMASDDSTSSPPFANPAALQMQLAAAQQIMLNAAAAAASNSGGSGGPAAMQQQKMMFANLLQQQHQQFAPYLAAAAAAAAAASATNNSSSNPNQSAGSVPGSTQGNNGSAPMPPYFGMYPPNALAAAAAAAAAAQSAQPLLYYPHLLQQAQAHAAASARMPNNNAGGPTSGNLPTPSTGGNNTAPMRPPFPMPPPGAFPNFPSNMLNPTAAAGLMAAALQHLQQQQQQGTAKPSSPGPSGAVPNVNQPQQPTNAQVPNFNNPAAAAAAAAATALMASRMGLNPQMGFPPPPPNAVTGFPAVPPFPVQTGVMPHVHSAPNNNPTFANQSQSQNQQTHHSQMNSPPRGRGASPAPATSTNSSSKLNASFIPTQVMMKNPHAAITSPDAANSVNKTVNPANRGNFNKNGAGKTPAGDSSNSSLSYSSVAAVGMVGSGNTNGSNNTGSSSGKPTFWTAEDLEKPFLKATSLRDSSASNYSSYPPLHQQASSNQRTAGVAAATAANNSGISGSASTNSRFQDPSHRVVETAHQFSVADLLRGAANAATKTTQSSSAGYT